ncbi:MAG: chorismate synthase [Coriobacteriia bacterium]|nr:chorismate synthase [Coriobacteriia bacterium]
MSSHYGTNLKVSLFGQSHSAAIGVVIDGLPAGLPVDLEELQAFLARRAPGQGNHTTARHESDTPEVLSGLVDGLTCGAPLAVLIRNTDVRTQDYAELLDIPRPSHADYPAEVKYHGFQDHTGGGHFSGRLTAPLCIAGGICLQALKARGILVGAHLARVGAVEDRAFDLVQVSSEDFEQVARHKLPTLDEAADSVMLAEVEAAAAEGDSIGGVIECAAVGLPAGIGDPLFEGIDNRIAQAIFGIPAVKGLEFGNGFAAAQLRGSQNNDAFYFDADGDVRTRTNNSGGILGGLTTGMPLIVRVAFKPTPSIAQEQESVNLATGESTTLSIKGRHDPCIAVRAVPVVEAAVALALYDAQLDS